MKLQAMLMSFAHILAKYDLDPARYTLVIRAVDRGDEARLERAIMNEWPQDWPVSTSDDVRNFQGYGIRVRLTSLDRSI